MLYIELFFFLPLLTFFYQLYRYAVSREGMKKEQACFALGISYATIGIVSLVFRNLFFTAAGLFLLMLGLLLLAKGLERKDKKIFIDRYDGDKKQ